MNHDEFNHFGEEEDLPIDDSSMDSTLDLQQTNGNAAQQHVKRTKQTTIYAPDSMDYIFNIDSSPLPSSPADQSSFTGQQQQQDPINNNNNDPLTTTTSTTNRLANMVHIPNPMKALSRINFKLPMPVKKKKKEDDGTNKSKSGPRKILINEIEENRKIRVSKVFKFGQKESVMGEQEIEVKTWRTPLFKSNKVRTTVYNWWNFIPFDFLPRNLLYQYIYQLHNWYFLIVMIFSLIPDVSPVQPVTSVLPVVFILGVNLLKDFVEDLRRYIADRTANNRLVRVVRDGHRMSVKTGSLRVGDIALLQSEDVVPADMLILYGSNKGNKCYIETSQLDGEANMKSRSGRSSTAYLNSDEEVSRLSGEICCNAPIKDLDKVEGTIKFINQNGEEVTETFGPENALFKGCTVKNTASAYGVVMYTGMESKIMLNTARKKKKRSFIDSRVNLILIILIFIHQILVIIFVILDCIYQDQWNILSFYIEPDGERTSRQVNFKYVIYSYMTNFILLNLLIPMSLFVSLQFIKEIQAFFMKKDLKLYYEKDDIPMNVGSADLNADLSQIDIVFSDKTGTLTNNTMNFKKLGIGSKITHKEDDQGCKGLIGKKLFSDIEFVPNNPEENMRHKYLAMQYMLNLVLNNEIIIENGVYSGESPDEVCLVQTAKDNGFELLSQTDNEIVVCINGVNHVFPKIQTIKFTPDRKRMSVIVTFPRTFLTQFAWFRPGEVNIKDPTLKDEDIPSCCFMKGADSFVIPWLAKSIEDSEVDIVADLNAAQKYLDEFATEGLRTLLLAHRVIVTEDTKKWKDRYTQASGVTADPKVRLRRMDRVAAEIEEEMELCGATAIEDELQENVSDTINFLLDAGIQFWILTGDKRQTAKNVAQLAGVIKAVALPPAKPTYVVDIELDFHPDHIVQYNNTIKIMNEALIDVTKVYVQDPTSDICLVMNGTVVGVLEQGAAGEVGRLFKEISSKCKTVIVCRAIPAHKQAVVKCVKKMFGKNGLAIGDGANDVSMIQAAKVGVGISGKEGSQAVNAADYALPRFFHLKRLLAVHGRYSLTRSALFVQYSFYKNLILTFVQFFFGFFCAFSGTSLIDSWVLTLYNLLFTLLPPFVLGVFEKDVDDVTLETWPSLYKNLKEDKFGFGQSLTLYSLFVWVGEALYHSAIIFFVTIFFCSPESLGSYHSDGFWVVSVIISVNLFVVVNAKVALEMNYFTILNHASIWLSLVSFFAFLFAYSAFKNVLGSSTMYYVVFEVFGSGRFYLISLLIVVLCLIPDICLKALKKSYFASEWEKRKRERLKEKRRLRKERRRQQREAKQAMRHAKVDKKYMTPLETYTDVTAEDFEVDADLHDDDLDSDLEMKEQNIFV